MTKTMSAVAVGMRLGAMPVAHAQAPHSTTANPHPATANSQSTNMNRAEETIQPDQIRGSKMIGSSVYDVQNRHIGKVRDLILHRDGKVAAVVVDVGTFLGMGGKSVAVKLSDLKTDNNRITLDRTKEQLQPMANYRLANRKTGAGSPTPPGAGGKLGSGR